MLVDDSIPFTQPKETEVKEFQEKRKVDFEIQQKQQELERT